MQRRRKVSPGTVGATSAVCNPGDTDSEAGAERWAGNPEEESPSATVPTTSVATPANDVETKPRLNVSVSKPVAAASGTAVMPSPKDRYPMPWGLVISDVFALDVHRTYARLEQELALGDAATEYGTVLRAVDASAKNLFDAARLARRAKLEDEKFAMELDQRLEVLRSAAAQALEAEKASGQRSKAPTIKDIDDRMLATWPDEVVSIRSRKQEMHGALRSIEALEMAWRERCQALRALAQQFNRAGA